MDRYARTNYTWPHQSGPYYGSVARGAASDYTIVTMVGSFDMSRGGFSGLPTRLRRENRLGELGAQYFMVQLHQDTTAETAQGLYADIAANGGEIVGRLPVNTFIARLSPAAFSAVQDTVGVTAIEPFHPALKLAPTIGRVPHVSPVKATSTVLNLEVNLFRGEDSVAVAPLIAKLGGNVTRVVPGSIYVELPQDMLTELANIESVQGIFEDLPIRLHGEETSTAVQVGGFDRLETDNSRAVGIIASGTTPYTDAGIDGGGGTTGNTLLLMVLDSGVQVDAQDLADTAVTAGVPGPGHRKVRLYETTNQFGGSGDLLGCDDPAYGGATHGHTVTATAIGNATAAFGTTVEEPGVQGRTYSVDGVAPGAAAVVYDAQVTPAVANCGDPQTGILQVGDLYDGVGGGALETALAAGASISNFSWGSDTNQYTTNAADIDDFLANNPTGLVFVAVGNSAEDADRDDVPDPGSVGTPGTAKNGVSVGSHQNISDTGDARAVNIRWNFSSVGPAGAGGSGVAAHGGSGRVAPLLMAPGNDFAANAGIDSEFHCRSNDNDQLGGVECDLSLNQSGTSFASAAAAGSALVILDYLQQGFYPDGTAGNSSNLADEIDVAGGDVSGALLKATLIASTRMLGLDFAYDVGSRDYVSRPNRFNNEQGYGRIQLDRVLPLSAWPSAVTGLILYDGVAGGATTPRDISGLAGSVVAGGTDSGTFEVCDEHQELRVALVWFDDAGDTLVNDLDLTVTSPGGQTYIGNFFTDDQDESGSIDGLEEDCAAAGEVDQAAWSISLNSCTGGGAAVLRDTANPTEGVFLSPDPDNDDTTQDSQLETGTWTIDVSADGMNLTSPQPFAVAISGGVCLGSAVRFDQSTYVCNESATIVVGELDEPADLVANIDSAEIATRIGLQVVASDLCSHDFTPCRADEECGAGNTCLQDEVIDSESGDSLNVAFDDSNRPGYVLDGLVVTDATFPDPGNGILDVRSGARIEVTYADEAFDTPIADRKRVSTATVTCSAVILTDDLKFSQFGANTVFDLNGGCERNARGQFEFGFPDRFMDAGETVSYAFIIGSGEGRDLWNLQASIRCVETDDDSPEACRPGTTDCDDPDRVNNPPCINETGRYVDIQDPVQTIGVFPQGEAMSINYTVTILSTLDTAADPQPEIEMLLELTAPTAGRTAVSVVANRHTLNVDEVSTFYSTDFPDGGSEIRDVNNNDVIENPTSSPDFSILGGNLSMPVDYSFETRTFSPLTANGKNTNLQSPWNFDNNDGGFTSGITAPTDLDIPDVIAQWGEDLDFDGMISGACTDAPSTRCERFPQDPVACPAGPAGFECVIFEDRDPTNTQLDQNWSTLGGCGFQTRAPGTCTLDSTVGCYTNDECSGSGTCDTGSPQNAGGVWHTGGIQDRSSSDADFANCLYHGNSTSLGDCQTFEVISGDTGSRTWHEVLVTPEMQKVSNDPDVRVEITWWAWNQSLDLPDDEVGYTWEVDTDTASLEPVDLFSDLVVLNSAFGGYGAVTRSYRADDGYSLFAPVLTTAEAGSNADAISVNGTVGNNREGRNSCFFEFGAIDATDPARLRFAGPPDDDATSGFCANRPDSELDGVGDFWCTWVCSLSADRCTVDADCPVSETCMDADPRCGGDPCIRGSADPLDVDRYVQANGPLRNASISDWRGPDMKLSGLEDLFGETGDTFQAAIGILNFESRNATVPLRGFGLAVDDVVFEWREVSEVLDDTDCATGQCAVIDTQAGSVFDGNAILEVSLFDATPYGMRCSTQSDNPNDGCFADGQCPNGTCEATTNDCDHDGDFFGIGDDDDCDNDGIRDVIVEARTEVELDPGEFTILNNTSGDLFQGSVTASTHYDAPGILFGMHQGTDLPTVTIEYEDIDDGAGSKCQNSVIPAQSGVVSVATQLEIATASVVITNVAVDDGVGMGTAGDQDGFADEGETVDLRIELINNSGRALTAVAVRLAALNGDPDVDCVLDTLVNVGSLAHGETRSVYSDAFRVRIANDVRGGPPAGDGDLFGEFVATIEADQFDSAVRPQIITLVLDQNASGGGSPTTFNDSFETGSLGSFTTNAIDFGLGDFGDPDGSGALVRSDGYRCQYHDPDWVNSNSFSNISDCYLNPTGAPDAFYWQTTPDRAFAGVRSLYWGVPLAADLGFTTPLARLQSVESGQPINLGYERICSLTRTAPCTTDADCPASETCAFASPKLSFKHQISLIDRRSVSAAFGLSADRGVVQLREVDLGGSPVGEWQELRPVINLPDTRGVNHYFQCTFDPIDDGNDEDSFFDPGDPNRNTGPSSTCWPDGFAFSWLGNTDGEFDADDLGSADGPGLQGAFGEGTWVESVFPLSTYRGKRIELRFLNTGIKVGTFATYEALFNFNPDPGDDGWWIDDLTITDTLTAPATLSEDLADPSLLPGCGATCNLMFASLSADPPTLGAPGQVVELSAADSIADRCVDGVLQFQFWRDGDSNGVAADPSDTLLRDFTSDPVFLAAPTSSVQYVVRARCATDPSCRDDGAVAVAVDCPASLAFDALGGLISSADGSTFGWPLAVGSAPFVVGNLDELEGACSVTGSVSCLSDADCPGVETCGGAYSTTMSSTVSGTSVSIAADVPPAYPDGLYYLIKEAGVFCNRFSWSPNASTPARDSNLP